VTFIPSEVSIFGIYFPPLLLAAILGGFGAAITARLLNRYRLSRFFANPPLVFLSFTVIYTSAIGWFLIPI
jgi:hypothetical protein